MSITIRPASFTDIPVLQTLFAEIDELHVRAHPERFRHTDEPARAESYLREQIGNPDFPFLVAVAGDGVVGFVQGAVYRASELGLLVPRRWLWVETLCVRSDWRRRGVGHALMAAVEAWAQAHDIHAVEFNVWMFNRSAVNFYQALGYHTITQRMWKSLE